MKGMHLQRGLSMINTKRRKTKITKRKMAELEVRWRIHNKTMKQKGMHQFRYETFEDYIDYVYGKVKSVQTFPTKKAKPNYRVEQSNKHKEKYPSMMEQQIKNGTFTQGGNTCAKKEPDKYTGTLVKGIATMHKSNAVPIISQEEATDIARMRRG